MTERDKRLAEFARVAVELEQRIKYPPTLLIAQWALESGWGKSITGDHNYFGITFNPQRHKEFRVCPTHEEMTWEEVRKLQAHEEKITGRRPPALAAQELGNGKVRVSIDRAFASYGSLDEALADKTSLIMNAGRYAPAFSDYRITGDVERLIDQVAAAGYATAGGYAPPLKQIARQGNVTQAIRRARQDLAA